jgi:xanthine dehydrogenase large subunit
VPPEQVAFEPNHVRVGNEIDGRLATSSNRPIWPASSCRRQGSTRRRTSTGTAPSGKGRPFYYFAYGAAVSEVSIDTLTGEYQVDRVDVLHDVGKSLNPALDIGQIEGAFVQGMGWLTTEELWWDDKGRLRTHAPSTYKIPLASDRPKIFNVELAKWSENREPTIRRSKAVGEPPFMLPISVLEALGMAVASIADYRVSPRLDAPATPERVLMAVERLKAMAADAPSGSES